MRAVNKWTKRSKYLKLSKYVIIICLFLSLIILGLTYYGTNVGNFLITIEGETVKSLSLSENRTFEKPMSLLNATGLKNMKDATLDWHIPDDIHETGEGSHNDSDLRYFAYSFYLKNMSTVALEYDMEIIIEEITKNSSADSQFAMDSALRVMVIRNGEANIYAKWQEEGDNIGQPEENEGHYEAESFLSNTRVCSRTVEVFEADEIAKYTVVMWLEGFDDQCEDYIKGDTLKMRMKFSTK